MMLVFVFSFTSSQVIFWELLATQKCAPANVRTQEHIE